MSKIEKYTVVFASSVSSLVDQVNQAISEGYQPIGGIEILVIFPSRLDPVNEPDPYQKVEYYQSLVKENGYE